MDNQKDAFSMKVVVFGAIAMMVLVAAATIFEYYSDPRGPRGFTTWPTHQEEQVQHASHPLTFIKLA
jgi:hypothetical protein